MEETNNFETFDFLVNEEDEVMLLLYEREGEVSFPHIVLNPQEGSALLYRHDDDMLQLNDISTDIFDSLDDADTLLVCELNRTDNEDETEVVRAYEAEIAY